MSTKESELPIIMEEYPGLKTLPWINLTNLPTPVDELTGLEKELDADNLYIKRDDLSNDWYGGNKPRKFEYVIGRAIKRGKRQLITTGGIGTNHGLAQTIICRSLKKHKLTSTVFTFDQPVIPHVRHNLLLEQYYGAEMHYTKTYINTFFSMLWFYLTHRKVQLVMPGASRPLGTVGFVNAAFELDKQIQQGSLPEPDKLYVPVGSTGTCAGLLLGLELLNLRTHVYGVSVTDLVITRPKRIVNLAHNTWKLLKKHDKAIPKITKDDLHARLSVLDDFFGGAYGQPTEEGQEALDLAAKTDDIKLDLTYSSKAFSAMLADIRENREKNLNKTILFWNTYNSVNHEAEAKEVDYHELPRKYHKFFNGEVPVVKKAVKARQ